MKRISHVKIKGVRFRVMGETISGSRGREFQLEHPEHPGLVYRVCHAPDPKRNVVSATYSGQILNYERSTEE